MDHFCLGNFTKEILYQFAAIPSLKKIYHPIEVSSKRFPFRMKHPSFKVSKIRVQMNTPFSVEYYLDVKNQEHFLVEQKENLGK